ncbi:type II secretion system protein [Candidatus Saccharibacteria bacterium]|nr:type II secretion system protein [Candidatus Saccharibacteria bacterium]
MSTKSKSGFTIIEVVLVLAIAGLIFLMVFIALPNMQRSQRDTQRRNDYSALSANITQYITNNNGSLPATGATLAANKYINETGEDPDGNTYILEVVECTTSGCTANFDTSKNIREDGTQVFLVRHGGCNGGALEYVKSNRAFAIYGQLETGEGSYCQSNS